MAKHERFHLKTLDDLKNKLREMNLSLPLSEDLSVMFEKPVISGRTLPNRFIVHPMEGFDADTDGRPGDLSFRRYKRYAEGGSGLIWFEATAVAPEARTNKHQFYLHEGSADCFGKLVEETRKTAAKAFGANHNPLLILQMTHSGRYSKKDGIPKPVIAHHSAVLDPVAKLPPDYPLITDDELERLKETFLAAGRLAKKAGFDGIDIKSCHRYLISELLASFTRENSRFGGSFENRIRFLTETAALLKKELGDTIITSRLNVYDAIPTPYGFGVDKNDFQKADLTEPLELIARLRKIDYPLLNITIGNPYYNPHYNRPYDFPIEGAPVPDAHPLKGVADFIDIAGRVQKAFPELAVVGSGYTWLRHLMPFAAAGAVKAGMAALIGQGRGAFAYPDSVKDLMNTGRMDPRKACVACSGCTQIMRDNGMTGCIVRDSGIYGPIYREGRRRSQDRLKLEAEKCRNCEFPNCRQGCPAGVDVPGFIKAFETGDIKSAYEILKKNNVLPELCAYVCPSEVQCEEHCMEAIMKGTAVPIRDIQLFVSKKAREMGLVTASVPEKGNGRKVAVVGAGPAGLACAIRLLEKGFSVDILDKQKNEGGTPFAVIPSYRLTMSDVLAEASEILKKSIERKRLFIRFGKPLSVENDIDAILDTGYDALFLGLGLGKAKSLVPEGGKIKGVEDAIEFLKRMKVNADTSMPARVAVLGGGNTAMDAALSAKKAGAKDVYLVYRRSFEEMPAWPKERDAVLNAGVHFLILSQPTGYVEKDGKLAAVKVARCVLGAPDASGRRRPVTVPGSESLLEADLAVEALGQDPLADLERMVCGVSLKNGFVAVDRDFRTSRKKVYAGGDIVNGGTTAVRAIAEGMKAADTIIKDLIQEITK